MVIGLFIAAIVSFLILRNNPRIGQVIKGIGLGSTTVSGGQPTIRDFLINFDPDLIRGRRVERIT